MTDKALSKAFEILGSKAALAERLKITREAVQQWKKCPVERVHAVSAATGGKVTPEQLRPDIFKRQRAPATAAPEASAAE